MSFAFTTEQKLLRDSVRKLMDTHANRDYVRRKDKAKAYPYELYDEWVKAGLLGVAFPEKYGGSGGSAIDLAICVEEIAYTSADFQMCFGGCVFCGLNLLAKGSEEQKAHWLPKVDLAASGGCRSRCPSPRPAPTSARSARRAERERQRLRHQRPEVVEHRRRRARQYDERLPQDRLQPRTTARACRCCWSTTIRPASS